LIILAVLWLLAFAVGILLAVAMVARVNREQGSPGGVIAWLLIIGFVPFVGVPLYLAIGGRKMQKMAGRKAALAPRSVEGRLPEDMPQMDRVFRNLGLPGVHYGNKVELIPTGVEMFRELTSLIDRARKSIYITTYQLGRDETGRMVVEMLAARAREGIEVRLNLDDIGSRYANRRFVEPLLSAGGQVAWFMPVLHIPFRGRSNLRNHRKIVITDNKWVMSGGANIAMEYMGPRPDPNHWRDLCFRLEGPAVQDFVSLFQADWEFASGESMAGEDTACESCDEGGAPVQVVPSGPDVQGDYLYDALIYSLFAAKERIWIVTPYFVPDSILLKGLRIAALRGVDVLLVLPSRSDHYFADVAGWQACREIQSAGGRVLLYTAGMMHAKVMVIDDSVAVVGSANLDMRSLFFNYEVVMFMYGKTEIQAAEEWVRTLPASPRPIEPHVTDLRHFGEGLIRMFAPLL
jgi:cardiolipin synthase